MGYYFKQEEQRISCMQLITMMYDSKMRAVDCVTTDNIIIAHGAMLFNDARN